MVATMPLIFWLLFYSVLFVTYMVASIFFLKTPYKVFSVITIIVVLCIPILHLIQAIPRPNNVTEFRYFWIQLKQGDVLCILMIALYIYMIIWWIFVYIQLLSLLFYKRTSSKSTN